MADRKRRKGFTFTLPQGLQIDLAQTGRQSGIDWVGRNKDGIPMWRGTWRGFPKWFVPLFKCLGIGLWCLAAIFAAFGLWQAVPGLAIAGSIHTLLGFVVFARLKRRFDSSLTAEEAAEQLGVETEAFKRFVDEKGIRPSHLYNDEPIYDFASLGDVGVLLRAADRPANTDSVLLRPAVGSTDVSADNLMRASSEPGSVDDQSTEGIAENTVQIVRP